MPVEEPLQRKTLGAEPAREAATAALRRSVAGVAAANAGGAVTAVAAVAQRHFGLLRRVRFGAVQHERVLGGVVAGVVGAVALADHHRVLDAVAAVDEFELGVARKSQLHRNVLQRQQQFHFN